MAILLANAGCGELDRVLVAALHRELDQALGALLIARPAQKLGHPDQTGSKAKAQAVQAAPPLQALAEYKSALHSPAPPSPSSDPYSWSALMRRVFKIDALRCTHCGGRRKLIAFITNPPDIRRTLGHRSLPADPPTTAPARPPPQLDFAF